MQYNMMKEIHEQPTAIADTLKATFAQAKEVVDLLDVQNLGMIYFTGSGTSYHACLAANYALSTLTTIFSTSLPASEFASWVRQGRRTGTFLVAISQSGESADVLSAVKSAADSEMRTIGVTNSPGSSLAKSTEFQLVSKAGEEKAVTATKSYTATLAATYALVLELSRAFASGAESYERLCVALGKASNQVDHTIRICDGPMGQLATKFVDREFYFILGSGPNYSTALEGALKLKETCNLHAEGFATREFLHGPIQLVDARTPVFVLRGPEEADRATKLEERFLRFGAPTIVIKQNEDHSTVRSLDSVKVATDVDEVFSPLVYVIPLQLYAYYLSLHRGLNPDRPEKLTKVVK